MLECLVLSPQAIGATITGIVGLTTAAVAWARAAYWRRRYDRERAARRMGSPHA